MTPWTPRVLAIVCALLVAAVVYVDALRREAVRERDAVAAALAVEAWRADLCLSVLALSAGAVEAADEGTARAYTHALWTTERAVLRCGRRWSRP